jgi:prepilin-type N-terminal cleavage/methylation domain-containing protein
LARLRASRGEAGFTLTELMAVMLLAVILMTLGAFAVRQYWLRRSLQGAQDQVVAQMRQVQQRSMAESYPIVYGIRFQKDTSNWGIVRYNASTGACQAVNNLVMSDGVRFTTATDFPDVVSPSTMSFNCRNAAPGASSAHEVVFFYPKGTANTAPTTGSSVILEQPALPKTATVTVSPLTGRVTRG